MPGHRLPSSASSKSLLEALDSPARLQEIFAGFRQGGAIREDDGDAEQGESLSSEQLEKQLLVSAQLGLALLEKQEHLTTDNKALQGKQKELEASISQLLDRLASSYKENAQLIKRAERAQANLDASEASNRQLLITLEEDRKTIKRLTAVRARSAIGGGSASSLASEIDDLRQELEAERKRANAADARARRATTKLSENENRLATISQQLDRAKTERTGRQSISSSRQRSRPNSISISRSPTSAEGDTSELRQVIEGLRFDNDSMQSDMQHLQDLLHNSRDQVSHLQAEQTDRAPFCNSDDDRESQAANVSLASDVLLSPDIDGGPNYSVSTAPTSLADPEWMPTPFFQSSNIMGRLPHTSTESNASSSGTGSRLGHRRRSLQRSMPSAAVRRMGGRAMSVDLSNMMQRKLEDLEYDYQSRMPSPGARPTSPQLRPFALGMSVNSLSSSLGSPALPTAHEDVREAEESVVQEGPTILEIGPSPVKMPYDGDGGLTKSSPTKQQRQALPAIMQIGGSGSKEASVQTEEPSQTQRITPLAQRPQYSQYTSSILSSDAASEHDSIVEHTAINGRSFAGDPLRGGNRKAALGTLLEHVLRLLTRLKAADIVSLEQRLKRQNLPGDVGHLAKSTMRDILAEVDGLRNHFRLVLEQETAAINAENGLPSIELSPESLMARKDFVTLVKLFRDILYELGRLRAIVNRVELEPHLASKLRDMETLQSPTDLLSGGVGSAPADRSAAATLLAPLSRLFSYGTESQPAVQPAGKTRPPLAKTKSSARPVPKLMASSALATATVNVEFGGQGGIRRQVSIMPQEGDGGLAGRYQGGLGRPTGAPGARQGVNRQLSSIFAGGSGLHSPTADPWVVLPNGRQQPRHSSAREAPASKQSTYRPLSQNVDAVIDNVTANGEEDDFRPNLLERTLRPRGLSDSSIHSTFLNHANPAGRLLTPAGLALSSTTAASHIDGNRTVRAAQTGATARPSVASVASTDGMLRKISGGMASHPSTGSIDSLRSKSPLPSPALEPPSDRPSPRKSLKSSTAGPMSIAGSSDGSEQLSKSPAATPSGLFAGLGAWAAKGTSSSYQESSRIGQRSASGSYRKPAGRDANA